MSLRNLPSVEQILQTTPARKWVAEFGRPLVLVATRTVLDEIRVQYRSRKITEIPRKEVILTYILSKLRDWTQPTLVPVINATGVILHTNLGRAPLSASAMKAVQDVSSGYSTLELEPETGKRGSRHTHVGQILSHVTGAEDGIVVNNNAAAVLLVLTALAKGKRVIIPRSQLVEIGGGFRVPDVMKQSGVRLVEIGTTNKFRLSDIEEALSTNGGLVMRAHRSNFKMVGFVEEPAIKEIIKVTHNANSLFIDDLGSGALLETGSFGLEHEPMVQESITAGADVVCFSGDKLIGGPQAGIIVGKSELITRIQKHPLARALRADKQCLAALSATLQHYLRDEAVREIPVWRMIAMTPTRLKSRAEVWKSGLGKGRVIRSQSTIGGGSLPGETLPAHVLALDVRSAEKFLSLLRNQTPAIIARTEKNVVLLDPRTVLPEQDKSLLESLKTLTSELL